MKELFKQWLIKLGKATSVDTYPASIESLSMEMEPANTTRWPGIFEYLIGEKPAKGPFEIGGLDEFCEVFGQFLLMIDATHKRYWSFDHAKYDQCFRYTHTTEKGSDHRRLLNALKAYRQFLTWKEFHDKGVAEDPVSASVSDNRCRQKIVYGAPGTGKSFRLNTDTADDENVFRVTFHPDSDYASFVGAYKPKMENVQRVVHINDGRTAQLVEGPDNLKYDKRISYSFVPQAFMNAYVAAWTNWANAEVEKVGGGGDGTAKPVFLIIEEINRGNCAQVFGDIFQLLDRSDVGWSTYPILADRDLGTWLNEKHFGTAAFASLANMSAPDKIKSSDWDAVRKGKMLLLPPNMYIWATMNTSDQSLFPIDSAFKRRWDWEYVPIREGTFKDGPKQGQKMEWKIQVGASHYDWWKFLKNANQRIFRITESEDKELGYFFVKPDGKTNPQGPENDQISSKRFVGKVIFYLWNDVFKDYGIETIFKASDAGGKSGEDAKGVAFQSFFKEDDDQVDEKVLESFFKQLELESDEEIAAAKAAASATVQANAVPAAAAATSAQSATGTPTATAQQGV